ncbi:S9 family peptidase [Flavobacterium album]|uniref:S9 family peptidase n=1 Tax=Flavobacterium album TaxID=2175091 RepID=A0A2S1QTG0_9FLAO|nr:prolyl oligopeptidase family serine peptidase [Flavobacterium album]AWH83720.1 S9 family peptidase [Flavobacterium album]
MKPFCHLLLFLLTTLTTIGQENLTYQKPPKEILELVDVQRAPSVSMDSRNTKMLFLYRNAYKTIADLSEDELKLGGLRINPKANISSTVTYTNNLKFKKLKDREPVQVMGLPQNPKLANFAWSPDEMKVAFTNTTATGVEVWLLDLATLQAKKLTEAIANANIGNPISWFRDGNALLVRMLPKSRQPLINTANTIPAGPTVTMSDGTKAQNRTYQDLLKNKNDEANFETLTTSELHKVSLDGKSALWKEAAMYSGISFSPDGNYALITTIHKPFSYIVTLERFPTTSTLYDVSGKMLKVFNEKPLIEDMPKGFMATEKGKRGISWRADKPATIVWAEALDGGDPAIEVPFRDELFELPAPFSQAPKSLVKTVNRFSGLTWGTDNLALITDNWWNTRNTRTYIFNPSDASQKPEIIFDRNYQDTYSDPGSFDTKRNQWGRNVLNIENGNAYLIGDGFTDKGQFPFIDQFNLATKKKTRLYQSKYTDKKESLVSLVDAKKGEVLVQLESKNQYPNYYLINFKKKSAPLAVSFFENPFKKIENVSKELIKYKRADGLELSGTLYLPAGYDKKKKEKLPLIMWAYPAEFKDKNSASQSTSNPNDFTYPNYGSPVYWVTRGYAVLDDASFPIIGEGKEEPNDTFITQLVADAKAAIDAVDALGYIDRNRVAVGGHSYGAFMTANLLTHSDLFAAGIARSGAYNRTLTPFGFQSEERNYWEAPEVYNTMSPFMHADKMKTPLLLIHGEADNNSGTFPMQSERYFNALKGFGAPVRFVLLPKESHGYSAIESILHLLWEQDQWLEKYVKNRVVK